MARCSITSLVVNDIFPHPVGKDIEGRFIYIEDDGRRWLLAAFDFVAMWRSQCRDWRAAVAAATGIPPDHIWLHTTQTHSGPEPQDLASHGEKLAAASIAAVRELIAQAVPAQMSYAIADLRETWNLNREQFIPGLGAVTIWQGFEYDEQGRGHVEDPAKMLLMDWQPDLPPFKGRILFDRPADPLAALLVFRESASGRVIGSLCRFSAHPAVMSAGTNFIGLMNEYRYHPDWPGYLRDAIQRRFGGTSVFVNGPCGNVTTKSLPARGYAAADAEARRIGEGIAADCLAGWDADHSPWEDLRLSSAAAGQVDLPLRDSIPRSRAEILKFEDFQDAREELWQQRKAAMMTGAPADVIKDLTDELQHFEWIDDIVNHWIGITDDELARRVMTIDLQAVALNDLVLMGMPGETMTETAMWLRAQSLGRRLILFDQVNGYHVYLTNPDAFLQGGYSYWCSVINRQAEPLMRRRALEIVRSVES